MKLFKNANLVNLENGTSQLVDILVDDNGRIKKIDKGIVADAQLFDLQSNYVIPPFVNSFCDSSKALENSYGIEVKSAEEKTLAQQLLCVKNLTAGAIILNDRECLRNIDEKEEKELDEICEKAAKQKEKVFAKVGLTLEELGAIDKHYGKMLSEVLEDFGFLDRGLVLVGGNCLEKDELRLLKNYDTQVVLTPNEDGRLGRRPTNLNALRNLDFDVALGSGDFAEIDFFAFMRQMILTQRGLFEDQKIMDEKMAFKIACNGNVVGVKNNIEINNFANFAVISKENSLQEDALKDLVWCKSKKDVLMTIYRGEFLQKSGEIFMQNLPQYDKIITVIQQKIRRK